MKVALAFILTGLLTACVSYRSDPRVVGRFETPAGEALTIKPDGRIVYSGAGREEFVGLVTIGQEIPLSIRVIAPDTSPLVSTKISFSEDRRQIVVEWPAWQRASGTTRRPTTFEAR
jgi:hypothetical protein